MVLLTSRSVSECAVESGKEAPQADNHVRAVWVYFCGSSPCMTDVVSPFSPFSMLTKSSMPLQRCLLFGGQIPSYLAALSLAALAARLTLAV